ncbi:hypothetical protein ENTCAN_08014 [Enterobacter cancerogenus ATCC 35316]|nr:hypothetical protein ENTCAN_08014 [Enterobacter cancerogenus ATCC 35316]
MRYAISSMFIQTNSDEVFAPPAPPDPQAPGSRGYSWTHRSKSCGCWTLRAAGP